MDLFFTVDSPRDWEVEKSFARPRAKNPDITAGHEAASDPETVYGDKDVMDVSQQKNITK